MEPKPLPKAQTPINKAAPRPGVVKSMDTKSSSTSFFVKNSILVFVVFILLGIGTGFAIAKVKGGSSPVSNEGTVSKDDIEKGTVVGSNDMELFKDTAEGTLKEGGIEDEGAYHLERPGGESQNVYLTSSVVDLSAFTGKKIKVWGKTFAGEKAGWLMDVGKVEVLK